jgi:branched-chain amino acid transport system permease protein
MNSEQLASQQSSLALFMAYVGGVSSFAGPIVGAVIVTFLQITLSDVSSVWQLYFGLMFIVVVLYAPDGVAGWVKLHRQAALRGLLWRLAPSYALVAPALAAACVGTIMLIELANRHFQLVQSEGSVIRLFGVDLDSATAPPWIVAILLFGAGVVAVRLLWPRVSDAWGAVHARLHSRDES